MLIVFPMVASQEIYKNIHKENEEGTKTEQQNNQLNTREDREEMKDNKGIKCAEIK